MTDRICRGCRVLINGEPHFHVGAQLKDGADGRAYTVQDPTKREPSVAIILKIGQGDLTMMMPEGFPGEAAMPVIQMMREQYQGKGTLSPAVINKMLDESREAFAAACANGSIVRDFQGKWHLAGHE